jgi:hypothetical protein
MVGSHRRFQHPANPTRYVGLLAEVVDRHRIRQAPDSCRFDVNPATGLDTNGFPRLVRGSDTLIQADRRCNVTLQFRMVDQVAQRAKCQLDCGSPSVT